MTNRLFLSFLNCFFLLLLNFHAEAQVLSTPGFIENKGQILDQFGKTNEEVLFLNSGAGLNIQLRRSGYSYEFFKTNGTSQNTHSHLNAHTPKPTATLSTYRVDLDFINANPDLQVERKGRYAAHLNYFIAGKEVSQVHSYEKVIYRNIYKNIDIEFLISENPSCPLKYNIILYPGADLTECKFLVKGATVTKGRSSSTVILNTETGSLTENIPLSFYSDNPSEQKEVNFQISGNVLSFKADYDRQRTFVIDPASSLQWGTFFGGNSLDVCNATGSDAQNNVYITGYALSTNNIATSGTHQNTQAGSFDVFIAKFNSAGSRLWGSYFGGSNFDMAYAMYVEPNGTLYITGDTFSSTGITTTGVHQDTYGGGIDDVFLAKFSSSGQRIWATYFGGAEHDIAQAITLNKAGDVIISGHTSSPTGIATTGAYSTFYNFNYDVFVAKFSPNGARLWGSYYGDSGVDETYAIGCDTLGNIYITGGTASIASISSAGAFQTTSGGALDAFIACFNNAGSMITWATFFGGSGNDFGTALEVRNNTIFLAGTTTSTNSIASTGAYQTAISSADDAFLASFTTSGARNWSSYYGGEDVDYINDIFLDTKSNILFCGSTMSSFSIATAGAHQTSIATVGNYDAFFAIFSPTGVKQLASYYGGEANDHARGITLDHMGKLYIAGETTSTLGIASPGAFMSNPGGSTDAFLAKFCVPFQPLIEPAGTVAVCKGAITLSATAGFSNYNWSNGVSTNPLVVTIFAPGNYSFSVSSNDPQNCKGYSDTTYISVLTCAGLNELPHGLRLQVFPSPAEDYISVTLENRTVSDKSQLLVYDAGGRLHLSASITEESTFLSVISLNPGLYILCVKTSEGAVATKFLKN